jgi:hypothetical protein
LTNHKQACDKRSEDLRKDIVWNLSPRESLPDGEAKRNGWVEMSTRRRTAGYDSKGDTKSISKSNLENGGESRFRTVGKERGLGSNARITALGLASRSILRIISF